MLQRWDACCSCLSRRVDYLSGSHFIAIGVHGGQDVDACVMYQPHDAVVTSPVLLAEELGELNEQLTPEHFVAMHVAHILKLRLHWRGNRVRVDGGGHQVRQSCQARRLKELPEGARTLTSCEI